MRRWFSSPKVRLALIVNGLYFISLVTPAAAPHRRPRLFPPAQDQYDIPVGPPPAAAEKRKPYVLAPLPPPSAPVKATTYVAKQFDQLDVYLTNDLTLLSRPDHRLLLSPTFTTRASKPEPPDSILLRFVAYSSGQTLSNTTPLTITADGREMIDGRARFWYNGNAVTPPQGVPFIEGLGVELPYELFLDIISARQVVIELGADRVELTANQIEALRDMHRQLPQQLEDPPLPAGEPGKTYGAVAEPRVSQGYVFTQPPGRGRP